MIRRDYIQRMIDLCARALARIMRLREEGKHLEAVEDAHQTLAMVLGTDPELLGLLSAEDFLKLIRKESTWDGESLVMMGRLLMQQAEIAKTLGRHDEGCLTNRKAIYALTEGLILNKSLRTPEMLREIAWHADLEGATTQPFCKNMFLFYEHVGHYDAAESWLFRWVDWNDHEAPAAGERFFGKLLLQDDEILKSGGLPRTEVQEGLRQWRQLTKGIPI